MLLNPTYALPDSLSHSFPEVTTILNFINNSLLYTFTAWKCSLQIPLFLVHFGLYANIIILDVFLVFLSSAITLCLCKLCILMCITSKSVFIAVTVIHHLRKSHNVSNGPICGHMGCFHFYLFANYCAVNFLIHILMPIHEVSLDSQLRAILYTCAPQPGTFDNVWKHFWLS